MGNSSRQFADVIEAWDWLRAHPAFDFQVHEGVLSAGSRMGQLAGRDKDVHYRIHDNTFAESLQVEFVRINPEIEAIDDDASKNTQLEVWLEAGGPVYDEALDHRYRTSHDYKLDCGGPSFEVALLRMAANVLKEYGDYVREPIIVESSIEA